MNILKDFTTPQVTRLPGGLTVISTEMPHMASVSLGLWVAVGGRLEPAQLNGASHFIEHMLFKGTRRRDAQKISEAVEGVGGYLNAFTSEEHTCFYAKAHHRRLDLLLDVLMDMFLHSRFDPAEIAKERDVIKEELAMYLDQPHQHVQELLDETLWPGHPLGRPLTGTVTSLDALTRRALLAYQHQHYTASATVVVAAGPIEHLDLCRAVQRYARHFPSGEAPLAEPFTGTQDGPRLRVAVKKTKQAQFALGIRACSRHDPRRYSLRVINAVLGENMSSRLFQVLREDRGLAYSVQSGLSFFDEVGALVISAGVDIERLPQVLRLIRTELRSLRDTLVPAAELRRARDYLIGQLDLGLEGTENQMMWLGEQWLSFGRLQAPASVQRGIAAVTATQVRAVARDFFRTEGMNLALVSSRRVGPGVPSLLAI